MHFDKKTMDFNEESYISCILDEEEIEMPSPHSTTPTAQLRPPSALLPPETTSQIFYCDKCNYSSTFQTNIVSNYDL